jgi:hypothetical protein
MLSTQHREQYQLCQKNPNWLRRYDPQEDKSRHAAADEACCYEMQRKYGWKLLEIEEINTNGLEVDCVF